MKAERGNRNNTERHRSDIFTHYVDLQFPNSHFAGSFQLSSQQATRTLQEQRQRTQGNLDSKYRHPMGMHGACSDSLS